MPPRARVFPQCRGWKLVCAPSAGQILLRFSCVLDMVWSRWCRHEAYSKLMIIYESYLIENDNVFSDEKSYAGDSDDKFSSSHRNRFIL